MQPKKFVGQTKSSPNPVPEKEANPSNDLLKIETQYFESMREKHAELYPNEFLLIYGEELHGHFKTMEEAVNNGIRQFGAGPFLVRQAGTDELEFAAHFFLRWRYKNEPESHLESPPH